MYKWEKWKRGLGLLEKYKSFQKIVGDSQVDTYIEELR